MPNISKFLFLILAILQFDETDCIYAQQNSRDVKILWQKEFIADSNLGYRLGSVMFSQDYNRLLLTGASYKVTVPPTKEFLEFWLWEFDPNGNMINNTIFDNTNGELNPYMKYGSKYMRLEERYSPKYLQLAADGNIQVMTFSGSGLRSLPSVMKVSREGKIISITPLSDPNEKGRYVCAMITCPDNNFFVIGSRVIKFDSNRKRLWEKSYPIAERRSDRYFCELLTEALPDVRGSGLFVGGFSLVDYDSNYFILRIDSNGNVLSKITFSSPDPGSEGSHPHLFRMDSGNIMVANDTNPNHDISEIMIRMYTCDLKLLFEKQLGKLTQEEYEESYKIVPVAGGGFALIDDSNNENLVLHLYDGEGNESLCVPLNIAWPYCYELEYGCNRLFIVMKPQIENISRKIKIVALEIN